VPSKAAAPTDWNDVLPRGSSALLVRGENDARRLGCIPVTFLSFLVMLEQSDMLTLRHLEESLWRRETRFDSRYMEEILAPEFIEFGRSGRKYSRADSLGLEAYDIAANLPLPDFSVQEVTSEVALVTYRSEVNHGGLEVAYRSSIWRRKALGWELVFHQGAPALR
jgi:hypothetical protein